MADTSTGGTNGVAMVAIVVLVVVGVLAGGYMVMGHGGAPTHAISGSISTPAGPISGSGKMQ